jgi:hypothetical protein
MIVGANYNDVGPLKLKSGGNSFDRLPGLSRGCVNATRDAATESGAIMAKRK